MTKATPPEFGASCTSVYTTTEKQDSYESLQDVLNAKCKDPQVQQVIKDMLDVCADITEALRTALVTVEGSTNDFGDAQLSVDVSTYHTYIRPNVLLMRDIVVELGN
jgi:sedoheptulose-bisphosphatase